jgi:heptosyltransferase-2
MGFLDRYKEVFTLPFDYEIYTYTDKYFQDHGLYKRFSKFFRRYIGMGLESQLSLEKSTIDSNDKKILWINQSAPSLGDSLMDLSSRVLLDGRDIDLYTDKKNKNLYLYDDIFNNIYSDENELKDKEYDLIIVDSYSSRSIKIKTKYFKDTPFVGMYGFYNGPEVNRVEFSFFKMNRLLDNKYSNDEILSMAKPSLSTSDDDKSKIDEIGLSKDDIVMSIGGEWDFKIYKSWIDVIKGIQAISDKRVVLIGSNNGIESLNEIKNSDIKQSNILDCVAKYSVTQTAEIISRCALFVGCDGGLMHFANSVNTPIMPLLARLEADILLTNSNKKEYLYDTSSCNNIPATHIIEKLTPLITD